MNKLFLIIVSLMASTSCGQKPSHYNVVVEMELEQYARSFELDMGVNVTHISIRFGSLSGSTVGLCTSWSNGDREIIIDFEFWDYLSEDAREQLMYHELGHCAMDLIHDATIILDPNTNSDIEASIMNPYFFGNDYNWSAYRAEYKEALKNRARISF